MPRGYRRPGMPNALLLLHSKNNRSFDTPVKGPPQGPRLHIDIPRVQLLIEDKEGIKQIGEQLRFTCQCRGLALSSELPPLHFALVQLLSLVLGMGSLLCPRGTPGSPLPSINWVEWCFGTPGKHFAPGQLQMPAFLSTPNKALSA